MKIKTIDDKEYADQVREALKANHGYCPCRLEHTEDTKCICKDFREAPAGETCHCGLYIKLEP